MRVKASRPLAALIPELGEMYPRIIVKTKSVYGGELYVKAADGITFAVPITSKETVGDLKRRITAEQCYPTDRQRIIFEGRQLVNEASFASYGVGRGSTIMLAVEQRGGGGGPMPRVFADVSNKSLLVTQQFDPSAPRWRIVRPGLNPEGRCCKEDCEAFDQLVIAPNDFESYKMSQDGRVECPLCTEVITPFTCGFYDCAWKYEGVRTSDQCSLTSQWNKATGYCCHRFNADEHCGCIKWESLLISVKPLGAAMAAHLIKPRDVTSVVKKHDKCVMCWSRLRTNQVDAIVASCGHIFHKICMSLGASKAARGAALTKCLVCFMAI